MTAHGPMMMSALSNTQMRVVALDEVDVDLLHAVDAVDVLLADDRAEDPRWSSKAFSMPPPPPSGSI
jgi:hypothetical protein